MANYLNKFVLQTAMCQNCCFLKNYNVPLSHIIVKLEFFNLKEELVQFVENLHDNYYPLCENRQLVISYSNCLVENSDSGETNNANISKI